MKLCILQQVDLGTGPALEFSLLLQGKQGSIAFALANEQLNQLQSAFNKRFQHGASVPQAVADGQPPEDIPQDLRPVTPDASGEQLRIVAHQEPPQPPTPQQGTTSQREEQLVSQVLTLQAQCSSLAAQLQQSKVQRKQLQGCVVSMQAAATCQTTAAQHHCHQLQQQLTAAHQQLTDSHLAQAEASKLLAALEEQCIDLHQQLRTSQAQLQQQEAAANMGKQQQESHIFTLQARCASLTTQLHEALCQKQHLHNSLAAVLVEAEAQSAAGEQHCCDLEQQLAQQEAASAQHDTHLQAQITALQAEVQQLKTQQEERAACSDAPGSKLVHPGNDEWNPASCKGSWLLGATMFGGLLLLGCWTANKCKRRRQLLRWPPC